MSKIKPAIYFVRVIGETKPGVWTQRTGEKFALIEHATTAWNAAECFARQHLGANSTYTLEVFCCGDEVKVERFNVKAAVIWDVKPC